MTPAEAFAARRAVMAEHREGIARQDRPAQRRGHALPGRALSPLPLQEVHRRPPRLRPGAGHRRRSAATSTTSSSRASTSTSAFFRAYENDKPAKVAHYFQWSETGAGRGRPGLRHRPPRHDQSAGDARQAEAPPRRDVCRTRWPGCGRWRRLCCSSPSSGPDAAAAGRHRPAPRRQRPQGVQRQYQGLLDPAILEAASRSMTRS